MAQDGRETRFCDQLENVLLPIWVIVNFERHQFGIASNGKQILRAKYVRIDDKVATILADNQRPSIAIACS